jgi:ABC-type protease/lipase transport system fused ATPase/permease subunit
MTFKYAREAFAAVFVLTLFAAGVAIGITSISGWIVLVVLALVSVLVVQRLWREPAQTLSESIQQARGDK